MNISSIRSLRRAVAEGWYFEALMPGGHWLPCSKHDAAAYIKHNIYQVRKRAKQ